jgi:hypothetical protein
MGEGGGAFMHSHKSMRICTQMCKVLESIFTVVMHYYFYEAINQDMLIYISTSTI